MKRLERQDYLNWLIQHKDKQIIKVVTGVRRCGKSTIFEIYRDYLLSQGILPGQIIALNFEDLDYEELTDYRALYQYVKERLCPDKMNYILDVYKRQGLGEPVEEIPGLHGVVRGSVPPVAHEVQPGLLPLKRDHKPVSYTHLGVRLTPRRSAS